MQMELCTEDINSFLTVKGTFCLVVIPVRQKIIPVQIFQAELNEQRSIADHVFFFDFVDKVVI